eukprot:UN07042
MHQFVHQNLDYSHFQSTSLSHSQGIVTNSLPPGVQRLLLIGDIHGCYDELIMLLQKEMYNPSTDMLILLGDLVGKGPKINGSC